MPFDMLLLGSLAAAFLAGFTAMFSIVNPIGNALTFLNVTADRSRAERAVLARRIGLYSLAVLLGSIWLGAPVLAFFGISIGALRIAGGLAVAVQAWAMLMAPDQVHDRGRGAAPPQDVAFFPLTMPFTTGPGAIAVAIALGAERAPQDGGRIGTTLAALAIAVLVGGPTPQPSVWPASWAGRANGCWAVSWPSCCCASACRCSGPGSRICLAPG